MTAKTTANRRNKVVGQTLIPEKKRKGSPPLRGRLPVKAARKSNHKTANRTTPPIEKLIR